MANKRQKQRGISTQLAKDAFSNIFKKRATQQYPSVPATIAEGFRGKQVLNLEKCISCSLCSKECPANAIEMVDVEGKKRPLIYLDRCVFCYQCADTCPRGVFESSKIFELAVTDKRTLVIKPVPVAAPAQATPSAQPDQVAQK